MNIVTDLSGEFHPQPKVFKAKKEPKPLKQAGKKTKAWDEAREELKKEFEEMGITECEIRLKGCRKNNFLSFAHIDKRKNLSKEDLKEVVLACVPCHNIVEFKWGREKMKEFLMSIIKNRKVVKKNES